MQRIFFILSAILLILVIFSGFFWFYEVRYFVGRADVSQASFSIDNSYVFVSPLRTKAASSDTATAGERVRITVFILNNKGLGVMGKKIVVEVDTNLKIDAIQGVTDQFGKAVFDVSSAQAGEYFLDIKIDNISLKEKAHVSFY